MRVVLLLVAERPTQNKTNLKLKAWVSLRRVDPFAAQNSVNLCVSVGSCSELPVGPFPPKATLLN